MVAGSTYYKGQYCSRDRVGGMDSKAPPTHHIPETWAAGEEGGHKDSDSNHISPQVHFGCPWVGFCAAVSPPRLHPRTADDGVEERAGGSVDHHGRRTQDDGLGLWRGHRRRRIEDADV